MSNPFDQLSAAISEAREVDRAVEKHAISLSRLLVGKLRHCHHNELVAMKKELQNYNIHTGKWKKKQ